MVTVQFFSSDSLPADREPSEFAYAVTALLDIIRQSGLDDILWLLTDAQGRITARAVPEAPLAVAALQEALVAFRLGIGIHTVPGAFAEAVRTGGLAAAEGQVYPGCPLQGFTLASPLSHDGRFLGCVGCVIPAAVARRAYVGLIKSLLSTAVSACVHVLKARQSVRELALLRQAMSDMAADEPCIVVDTCGRIQYVTQAAADLLRRPKAALSGREFADFVESGLPEALFLTGAPANPSRKAASGPRPPVTGRFTMGSEVLSVTFSASPVREQSGGEALGWCVSLSCGEALAPLERTRPGDSAEGPRYRFADIICADPAQRHLISFARMVAQSSSNILITGESGTGKELFAQSIHRESPYASGPFVALNCSALPRDLVETELFGYQEGAFTGARRGGYKGKVLQANRGTLFLDEIGDMPVELQSRLLRVLQERTVLPVGGSRTLPVNIRLVAATNSDLEAAIAAGSFRADLFYRLNVVRIHLIPLRQRPADILPLARHFLSVYTARLGRRSEGFTPEAECILQEHSWPGNVRELENAVECAVNVIDGSLVEARHLRLSGPSRLGESQKSECLPDDAAQSEPHKSSDAGRGPGEPASDVILSMDEYEMRQIVNALEQCEGNISDAARALHIGRTTLYRKLKKHHLEKKIQIHKEDL